MAIVSRSSGLDYLTFGMGWYLDHRNKTGKLWRIKRGFPYYILIDKFGYNVIKKGDGYSSRILTNPKDGSVVVLGAGARDAPMSGNFLCDKVRAKKYGLHKLG